MVPAPATIERRSRRELRLRAHHKRRISGSASYSIVKPSLPLDISSRPSLLTIFGTVVQNLVISWVGYLRLANRVSSQMLCGNAQRQVQFEPKAHKQCSYLRISFLQTWSFWIPSSYIKISLPAIPLHKFEQSVNSGNQGNTFRYSRTVDWLFLRFFLPRLAELAFGTFQYCISSNILWQQWGGSMCMLNPRLTNTVLGCLSR